MADFPTDPLPDYPIEETPAEPEVLISTHRDGSEQRRKKGAGKGPTYRMSFGTSMPITNDQRLNLVNHFADQDGTTLSFDWTHPERAEVILCRYLARPSFTHVGFNCYTASVELQEVAA